MSAGGRSRQRWVGDLIAIGIIIGILVAASGLPPDTSLRIVRERGTLRACLPETYPPLVTGDAQSPGVDVEVLEEVAGRLGVRLVTVVIPEIGRDFNPRSWRITRAQCEVIAGGVVVTNETRSFLETTPPHLETAWAAVSRSPEARPALGGASVGFLPGATGLDRIALSSFLRSQNARVTLFQDPDRATEALSSGTIDHLVTEGLLAQQLASDRAWTVTYLQDQLTTYPIAFGLWKGDLTLKRAIVDALERSQQSGEIDGILERYALTAAPDAS